MKQWAAQWRTDKLHSILIICWLATVFASFFGDYLLPVTLPAVGTIFLFRMLIPVTAVLYLLWAIRERVHLWKGTPALEKWCYVMIAVLVAYGAVSLFWSIEIAWSFRKLMNLCFDLCFFFLMLRLCRDRQIFRYTLWTCGIAVGLLLAAGVYEIFFGGIFNNVYGDWKRFHFFTGLFQFPLVTYSNTNDFTAALGFCFSILLLAIFGQRSLAKETKSLASILLFPIMYLLIIASGARLSLAALYILLVGVCLFLLITNRRKLWIPLLAVVLIFGVQFANQYRFIVPPIQQYFMELKEYRESIKQKEDTPPTEDFVEPAKPNLIIQTPKAESLNEQLFEENQETGQKELRNSSSAGARAKLLVHSLDCFKESWGLGVGIGNAELRARERQVTGEEEIWNIHCFAARLLADYGIFALIPLCAIALLLLKRMLSLLLSGIRRRDMHTIGFALLYLCTLITYPFYSTAPSDAQDIIAMWIYLAAIVLIANQMEQVCEQCHA